MALQGSRELRARMKAIRQVFKPIGGEWADDVVAEVRSQLPPGRVQATVRRKNASTRKATVVGHPAVLWLDRGTKAHDIEPKRAKVVRFSKGGRPIFAKRVRNPGERATHLVTKAAQRALEQRDLLQAIVDLWNRAA